MHSKIFFLFPRTLGYVELVAESLVVYLMGFFKLFSGLGLPCFPQESHDFIFI